jgi:hypothetical protein
LLKKLAPADITSAAEAAIGFVAFTARLEAAPFQNTISGRVFSANC